MTPTVPRLRIFISWAAEQAQTIGSGFATFLPDIVNAIEPFISASNIDKGTQWGEVLKGNLQDSACAIVCLTPESVKSIWVAFETGAVSRAAGGPEGARSRIWTYLMGLENQDLELSPFAAYQSTGSTELDTFRLVGSINQLSPDSVSAETLKRRFDGVFWPNFSKVLEEAKSKAQVPEIRPVEHSQDQLLSEILRTVRSVQLAVRGTNADITPSGRYAQSSRRNRLILLLQDLFKTPGTTRLPVISFDSAGVARVLYEGREFLLNPPAVEEIANSGTLPRDVAEELGLVSKSDSNTDMFRPDDGVPSLSR